MKTLIFICISLVLNSINLLAQEEFWVKFYYNPDFDWNYELDIDNIIVNNENITIFIKFSPNSKKGVEKMLSIIRSTRKSEYNKYKNWEKSIYTMQINLNDCIRIINMRDFSKNGNELLFLNIDNAIWDCNLEHDFKKKLIHFIKKLKR